jgi:hypothetical protein
LDLVHVAKWAGGGFTYDKNHPTKGTLKKAIEQLKAYLPPGVVPTMLPPAIGTWIGEANDKDRENLARIVTDLSKIMSSEVATREAKRLMEFARGLTINSIK